jgi:hypothetical protein
MPWFLRGGRDGDKIGQQVLVAAIIEESRGAG